MGKEEIKKYRKDRERMRWERKIKIGEDWDKRKEKKRKKSRRKRKGKKERRKAWWGRRGGTRGD